MFCFIEILCLNLIFSEDSIVYAGFLGLFDTAVVNSLTAEI
jgi:hypothetical protein